MARKKNLTEKQKKTKDIRSEVIETENDLLAFFNSLRLNGFFKETRFKYLKAVQYYLTKVGKPVTPDSISDFALETNRYGLDALMHDEHCRQMLTVLVHSYERNDFDFIRGVLEELDKALINYGSDIVNYEFRKYPIVHWQKKLNFIKGTPEEVIGDKVLQECLDMFFNESANNKETGRNLFLIDPTYPQMAAHLYERNNQIREFHVVSLKDYAHTVRINPLDGIGHDLHKITSMASTVASYLYDTDDNISKNVIYTYVGACLACLSKTEYFTLPHLMAMLTIPYDKIRKAALHHPVAQIFVTWMKNLMVEPVELTDILAKMREKADALLTDEWCWLTIKSELDVSAIMRRAGGTILVVDDDKDTSFCMLKAALYECVRQLNKKEFRTSGSWNDLIAEPWNLIVVPDGTSFLLGEFDITIGLRNNNPFRLVVGYTDSKGFHKFYSEEYMNGFWEVVGALCYTDTARPDKVTPAVTDMPFPVLRNKKNMKGLKFKIKADISKLFN